MDKCVNLSKEMIIVKSFEALGTMNTIKIQGLDDEFVIDKAIKRVIEIDDSLSAFKKHSEIARINANAGKDYIKASFDTMTLLKRAKEFSRVSEGVFDITTRPLIELWGIGKKGSFIPTDTEIEKARALVNFNDLILDEKNCRAKLENINQAIDLGGIAKGHAADEVKRILVECNVQHALINLGGNIITIGNNINGKSWRLGIQNPIAPTGQYIGTIEADDKTVVTSGTNERFFMKDGKRYHHIFDPRTGKPAETSLLSVTVVGNCSMDMDALTTSLFVLGKERGLALLAQFGCEAIFILENLEIFATAGIKLNMNSNIEKR